MRVSNSESDDFRVPSSFVDFYSSHNSKINTLTASKLSPESSEKTPVYPAKNFETVKIICCTHQTTTPEPDTKS